MSWMESIRPVTNFTPRFFTRSTSYWTTSIGSRYCGISDVLKFDVLLYVIFMNCLWLDGGHQAPRVTSAIVACLRMSYYGISRDLVIKDDSGDLFNIQWFFIIIRRIIIFLQENGQMST